MDPLDSLLLSRFTVTTKKENGCICGYIDTEENYQSMMAEMKRIGYTYGIRSSKSHGASCGKVLLGFQLMKSEAPIQFFGSPFQSLRTMYLHCSRGIKYYKTKAERLKEQLGNCANNEESPRKLSQKVGCPAKLIVRCVNVFPEYDLKKNHWRYKDMVIKRLKCDLNNGFKPKSFLRFFIEASLSSCHNHIVQPCLKKQRKISEENRVETAEENLIPQLQEMCKQHASSILNSIDDCHDSSILIKTLLALSDSVSGLKNTSKECDISQEHRNSCPNFKLFNVRHVCVSIPYLPEMKVISEVKK